MKHASIYQNVRETLVGEVPLFADLTAKQKDYVAEKLTAFILEAEPDNPLSITAAQERLDRLHQEALTII